MNQSAEIVHFSTGMKALVAAVFSKGERQRGLLAPVGAKQSCFSPENRCDVGVPNPYFKQVDGVVADQLLLVVAKDLDPRPCGVRAENSIVKFIYIKVLEDLALDLIKLADKAPLLLFSETAWIYGFARRDFFQVRLPLRSTSFSQKWEFKFYKNYIKIIKDNI
jgi:hypothetical protein